LKTATLSFDQHHLPLGIIFLKNLSKLILAGLMIGLLHASDGWVALILAIYMLISVGKKFAQQSEDRFIYLTGLIISAIFGVLCELWGIYFGYWQYHDLANGREFPFWLPFAWGLAFTYIYKIEKQLVLSLPISSFSGKLIMALLVAMVFPTIGEIITINLGVWTYTWPYQILGVPILAIFLLMVFHSGVNLLMTFICRKNGWKDPVFNP
jgi:hypothetical protein